MPRACITEMRIMKLFGKKFLTGLLCALIFLVNLSGCSFFKKNQYEVFSDQNRCVTMVSASRRFLIGIVLDEKNLLLSDYTGKTIAERAFDQRIVSMDIYEHQILLAFEDNHIEVYQETDGELNEKYSKEFENVRNIAFRGTNCTKNTDFFRSFKNRNISNNSYHY